MYIGLFHTHSTMRYIILAVLIIAVIKSLFGWNQKSNYGNFDNRLAFLSMLFIHLQLVIGLILYFLSPKVMLNDMATAIKVATIRYYTVEHLLMMLIVVALVTIGRIASKKKALDEQKHKSIAIYYGLSLVLILLTVYVMMPA
jgi:cytochrome bd-type quinol oxidase subunit 2